MKNKNVKWSHEMRKYIYTVLRDRFGPLSGWPNKTTPGTGNGDYSDVLRTITDNLNAYYLSDNKKVLTVMAVKQQINWAIQRQESISNRGYVYCYILNTCAALEVGFMKSSDLSSDVLK